jgi:phasin family protein
LNVARHFAGRASKPNTTARPNAGWFAPRNLSRQKEEETLAQDTQSYLDMLRKFGSDIGLPKLDLDKLIETHRKNIDALGQSAKVAAGGAQSVAQKQREIFEAGLREASTMAQSFQPLGNPQDILAKQTEFARKVFDIAVQGARDTAQLTRESTGDAAKIIRDRMKESLEEMRGRVSRTGGSEKST